MFFTTSRPRTSSQQKHLILLNMQSQFRKVDPNFNIKYYLNENEELVMKQRMKYRKNDSSVQDKQIEQLVRSIKSPLNIRGVTNTQQYIETSPRNDILHDTGFKSPRSPKQINPLKRLFSQYKDVVVENYQKSSPDMKQLIDSYSQNDSNVKAQQKSYTQSSRFRISSNYASPRSVVNQERQLLLNKNCNNINRMMDLQREMTVDKKQFRCIQRFNTKLRQAFQPNK